eukprot:Rhum_TRINITY_DN11725_c1_g1::Rhum_TRINITY_DN11725_c1_g1_i1::g.46411::m.46411
MGVDGTLALLSTHHVREKGQVGLPSLVVQILTAHHGEGAPQGVPDFHSDSCAGARRLRRRTSGLDLKRLQIALRGSIVVLHLRVRHTDVVVRPHEAGVDVQRPVVRVKSVGVHAAVRHDCAQTIPQFRVLRLLRELDEGGVVAHRSGVVARHVVQDAQRPVQLGVRCVLQHLLVHLDHARRLLVLPGEVVGHHLVRKLLNAVGHAGDGQRLCGKLAVHRMPRNPLPERVRRLVAQTLVRQGDAELHKNLVVCRSELLGLVQRAHGVLVLLVVCLRQAQLLPPLLVRLVLPDRCLKGENSLCKAARSLQFHAFVKRVLVEHERVVLLKGILLRVDLLRVLVCPPVLSHHALHLVCPLLAAFGSELVRPITRLVATLQVLTHPILILLRPELVSPRLVPRCLVVKLGLARLGFLLYACRFLAHNTERLHFFLCKLLCPVLRLLLLLLLLL